MSPKSSYFKDFAKRMLEAAKETEEPAVQVADTPPILETEVQNRALSIRQPYAEQIMLGTKTIEYRSMRTNIRERVYIYASLTPGPDWQFQKMAATPGVFPTGVIMGTVEIIDCTGVPDDYEWHLARPIRLDEPIKPDNHPQPSWFIPFNK
jgi:hypothetical protein